MLTFLRAGDSPIAFTPGSAMVFGHEFFDTAVRACAILKRRGILRAAQFSWERSAGLTWRAVDRAIEDSGH